MGKFVTAVHSNQTLGTMCQKTELCVKILTRWREEQVIRNKRHLKSLIVT